MTIDAVAPGSYKLTLTVLAQIEGALRATATQEIAAKRGHITPKTFKVWLDHGLADVQAIARERGTDWQDLDEDELLTTYSFQDQPFVHFYVRCERAVVDFILLNAASVSTAGRDHVVEDTKTTTEEELQNGVWVVVRRTTVVTARHVHHWQASAWMLERRFPDLFARTIRQEVTGAQGGPVQVDTEGARLRLVEKLNERRSNDERAREIIDAASSEVEQAS